MNRNKLNPNKNQKARQDSDQYFLRNTNFFIIQTWFWENICQEVTKQKISTHFIETNGFRNLYQNLFSFSHKSWSLFSRSTSESFYSEKTHLVQRHEVRWLLPAKLSNIHKEYGPCVYVLSKYLNRKAEKEKKHIFDIWKKVYRTWLFSTLYFNWRSLKTKFGECCIKKQVSCNLFSIILKFIWIFEQFQNI